MQIRFWMKKGFWRHYEVLQIVISSTLIDFICKVSSCVEVGYIKASNLCQCCPEANPVQVLSSLACFSIQTILLCHFCWDNLTLVIAMISCRVWNVSRWVVHSQSFTLFSLWETGSALSRLDPSEWSRVFLQNWIQIIPRSFLWQRNLVMSLERVLLRPLAGQRRERSRVW